MSCHRPWAVAKGVGVLATGHVLPAYRTPTHPLRWLGFGRRCPVAILVQAQLYFVSLVCPWSLKPCLETSSTTTLRYAAFGRWGGTPPWSGHATSFSGLRVLAPVSFQATLQALYTDGADLFGQSDERSNRAIGSCPPPTWRSMVRSGAAHPRLWWPRAISPTGLAGMNLVNFVGAEFVHGPMGCRRYRNFAMEESKLRDGLRHISIPGRPSLPAWMVCSLDLAQYTCASAWSLWPSGSAVWKSVQVYFGKNHAAHEPMSR